MYPISTHPWGKTVSVHLSIVSALSTPTKRAIYTVCCWEKLGRPTMIYQNLSMANFANFVHLTGKLIAS